MIWHKKPWINKASSGNMWIRHLVGLVTAVLIRWQGAIWWGRPLYRLNDSRGTSSLIYFHTRRCTPIASPSRSLRQPLLLHRFIAGWSNSSFSPLFSFISQAEWSLPFLTIFSNLSYVQIIISRLLLTFKHIFKSQFLNRWEHFFFFAFMEP